MLLQHAPLEGRHGRLAIVSQRDGVNRHHKLVLEVDLASQSLSVTVIAMLTPTLAYTNRWMPLIEHTMRYRTCRSKRSILSPASAAAAQARNNAAVKATAHRCSHMLVCLQLHVASDQSHHRGLGNQHGG